MILLRWYIARIYDDITTKSGDRYIEVVVTPIDEESKAARILTDRSTDTIPRLKEDDPLLWLDETEHGNMGFVNEKKLIAAISRRYRNSRKVRQEEILDVREIKEDMVFLQQIEESEDFNKIWDSVMRKENLLPLLRLKAYWTDFTLQARKMASNIYDRVLMNENRDHDETK